jgi:outer membrane lipoprotein-sorting protein
MLAAACAGTLLLYFRASSTLISQGVKMNKIIATLVLALVAAPAFAQQKPCEELKADIAKKLDDKGVKDYQLEVVPTDQVKDQKVVGSCEGGTKKITYKKGKS